jgi:hypothetical protein
VFLFWKVAEEEPNTTVETAVPTFLPPEVVVTATSKGNYLEGENISALVSTWKIW